MKGFFLCFVISHKLIFRNMEILPCRYNTLHAICSPCTPGSWLVKIKTISDAITFNSLSINL